MSEESGHCHNWTGWRMCGHNVHDLRWAELVCFRVFQVESDSIGRKGDV